MPEQLTIFGLWERVVASPEKAPPEPLADEAPPADPRQVDLFSGPHSLRAAVANACGTLDAAALRRAYRQLLRKHPGDKWAEDVPAWAEGIEWLVGEEASPLTVDVQVDRALALQDKAVAQVQFPDIPGGLLRDLRAAALRRAAERLVTERGANARLPGGRPAGYLLLLAEDPARARSLLAAAAAAASPADARLLGYLGEAASRAGDAAAALDAYVHACLVDPAAIDQAWLTCPDVLELIDEAEDRELPEPPLAYVPVLADLLGRHSLGDAALNASARAQPARRLAALLRAYRRQRAAGAFDEVARLDAKREMLRLAPAGLRELLRPL